MAKLIALTSKLDIELVEKFLKQFMQKLKIKTTDVPI